MQLFCFTNKYCLCHDDIVTIGMSTLCEYTHWLFGSDTKAIGQYSKWHICIAKR